MSSDLCIDDIRTSSELLPVNKLALIGLWILRSSDSYLGLTSLGQVVLEMIQTMIRHDMKRCCLPNQKFLKQEIQFHTLTIWKFLKVTKANVSSQHIQTQKELQCNKSVPVLGVSHVKLWKSTIFGISK